MKTFFVLLTSIFISGSLLSQDIFPGTWTQHINLENSASGLDLSLQISNGEKNILYPAELKVSLDSFKATYQLLLVKKNMRQLAVSTQKFTVASSPLNLGNLTALLNGTFNFGKDAKGKAFLELNRIPVKSKKNIGLNFPDLKDYPKYHSQMAANLFAAMENGEIILNKQSNQPWVDSTTLKILQPKLSPAYFGLIDTIFAKTKFGSVKFLNNNDIDIISLKLNNNNFIDQIDSKKNRDNEDFILDTGLNILVFFADDFGKNGASSAGVKIQFDNTEKILDFKEPQNTGATFIVAKIYLKFDESSVTKFETYPTNGNDQNSGNGFPVNNTKPENPTLNRPGKLIGSVVSHSQQITFAIWDDAVEDGDTISLSINDKWITKNFPVLKRPQFITVTLNPGPNIFTFVAENLGSIIPNTSVLEIIDGKKRQSFYIETDLNQNNLIKIFYDLKPE